MKPVSLIINYFPTACIILLITGCNTTIEKINHAQLKIDSISAMFVPDRRMGICDIKLSMVEEGAFIIKGETTNPHLRDAIIKTLSNRGSIFYDSIIILPDTINNMKFMGLITLSVVNIRKQPDQRAEMVSQAILGTPVRILKNEDSWILVQTPDLYIGWSELSSVEPMTVDEMEEWKRSDRVISKVNSGWIYSSPEESEIVGDIVAGSILIKEKESHGYTKVRYPDGRQGYVNSKSIMNFDKWKANVQCTGENIVFCASTFMGLPYLWGGTSAKAFDCSGFSKSVYYLNGIILLRDASMQALHGLNVDLSTGYGLIKPGDLLFFGSRENSKLHVTHVAIYKGDSEYIHSSGRVMINSLDSTRSNFNGYRKNSLLVVKRIIGADNDPGIMLVKSHPWY